MIKIYIDKVLKETNKTPYWLSKQTGISQNNLSKLIKDETNSVKFDNLDKIVKAFRTLDNNIKLSDIIDYIDEEKVEE